MASSMIDELIHPTAIISQDAELAPDVVVGPYAVIEGPVRVGSGSVIEGHACLTGPMTMGRRNTVGHAAVLGKAPQHRGYRGEETELRIGDDNVFREFVTVHRGTPQGGGVTRIGNNNMFMIGSHLGHDATVGDGCTLVNNALVAGHVELGDGCILSGHSAVQQRVRVGRLAMLGGLGSTSKDVPPFLLQQGYNCVSGLNLVGLRRAGVGSEAIERLRTLYRMVYKEARALSLALEHAETHLMGDCPLVREWIQFVRASKLGINPARTSKRHNRTF